MYHLTVKVSTRRFIAALTLFLSAGAAAAADEGQLARGEYIYHAANCQSCHTDAKNKGALLAGGRPLETPFGTFYSPNITPDEETGIGGWSDQDFIAALREGRAPDGSHYFPVFPYTSYSGMTDEDMLDLKAYIDSLPAVQQENKAHEVDFPFGWRFLQGPWKWLNFTAGPFEPDPDRSEEWNRGAYLVEVLGHCQECHTPRGLLGGLDESLAFAGAKEGPDGEPVPNITPDEATGIGNWRDNDLTFMFKTSLTPSGDAVGGGMGEVVQNSTRYLTDEDLKAIVTYLRSLEPIENQIGTPKPAGGGTSDW